MPVDTKKFGQGQGFNSGVLIIYAYPTEDTLEELLAPGYFSAVAGMLANGRENWILLMQHRPVMLLRVIEAVPRRSHVAVELVGAMTASVPVGAAASPPAAPPKGGAGRPQKTPKQADAFAVAVNA